MLRQPNLSILSQKSGLVRSRELKIGIFVNEKTWIGCCLPLKSGKFHIGSTICPAIWIMHFTASWIVPMRKKKTMPFSLQRHICQTFPASYSSSVNPISLSPIAINSHGNISVKICTHLNGIQTWDSVLRQKAVTQKLRLLKFLRTYAQECHEGAMTITY